MNWYKKANVLIAITLAEKEWADWALDPMWEYWTTESGAYERDGQIYEESHLPRIEGNNLFISDIPEINEDLLYRLEEQAPAVAECDAVSEQQKSARCRSSFSLAQKIRGVMG